MKKITFLLIAALFLITFTGCDHDGSLAGMTEDERGYLTALNNRYKSNNLTDKGALSDIESLDGVWFARGTGAYHYLIIDSSDQTVQFVKYRRSYVISEKHPFVKNGDKYVAEYDAGVIKTEHFYRSFWLNNDCLEYDNEHLEMKKVPAFDGPDTNPSQLYEAFRVDYGFDKDDRNTDTRLYLFPDKGTFKWDGVASGTFTYDATPFTGSGNVRCLGKLSLHSDDGFFHQHPGLKDLVIAIRSDFTGSLYKNVKQLPVFALNDYSRFIC